MKKSEWNESLNNIDDELVNEYILTKEKLARKKRCTFSLLSYGTIAACFALIVGVIITSPLFNPGDEPKIPEDDRVASKGTLSEDDTAGAGGDSIIQNDDSTIQGYETLTPESLPSVSEPRPLYPQDLDTVTLTADEFDEVFEKPKNGYGLTDQYTKIYKSFPGDLYIEEIPNSEYLPILSDGETQITEKEFQDFIDKYIDKVSEYFEVKPIQSDIYQYQSMDLNDSYSARVGDISLRSEERKCISFYGSGNTLLFSTKTFNSNVLSYENTLLVDDTDEQVKAKINNLIDELCDTFGKDYKDIDIVRHYNEKGLYLLSVYLYNSNQNETIFAADPYRKTIMTEYIELSYSTKDNNEYFDGSKDVVYLSDITLRESYGKWVDYYNVLGKSRLLSLEEAEELLRKGYVFGRHSCPLCLQSQPLVDFSNYDHVSFCSLKDIKNGLTVYCYEFYKFIGKNENGLSTYAVTYVPATELEGLDEHFDNQKKLHRNTYTSDIW